MKDPIDMTTSPNTDPTSTWLSVPQIARRWCVANMTIYRMIKDNELKHMRVRNSFRVPLSEVLLHESEADRA